MMGEPDTLRLRSTLDELYYSEPFESGSQLLIEHLLRDLLQATQQYTSLAGQYDELYDRSAGCQKDSEILQSQLAKAMQEIAALKNAAMWKQGESFSISTEALLNEDTPTGSIDESFIQEVVDKSRAKIETLERQVFESKGENEAMRQRIAELEETGRKAREQIEQSRVGGQEDPQQCQNTGGIEDSSSPEMEKLAEALKAKTNELERLKSELSESKKPERTDGKNEKAKQEIMLLSERVGQMLNIPPPVEVEAAIVWIENSFNHMQKRVSLLDKESTRLAYEVDRVINERRDHENVAIVLRTSLARAQAENEQLKTIASHKGLEAELHAELSAQVAGLNAVNQQIKEKIGVLEQYSKREASEQPSDHYAQKTIQALLESLSTELSTESTFTDHLSRMVEKLNARRTAQDTELENTWTHLRDLEARLGTLETEKASLRCELERASEQLERRQDTASNSEETIAQLRASINAHNTKFEDQQRYIKELLGALEASQASMTHTRQNEELIREHIKVQDSEIDRLRGQLDRLASERSRVVLESQQLEARLNTVQKELQVRVENGQQTSHELSEALQSLERKNVELRQSADTIVQLEDTLKAKRREKDLMMATYCRLIKENERLHDDMKQLREQISNQNRPDERIVAVLESKLQQAQTESEALKKTLHASISQIEDLRQQTSKLQQEIREAENSKRTVEAELGAVKAMTASLDRNKKEAMHQYGRLGQEAAHLRTTIRQLELEKAELQGRIQLLNVSEYEIRRLQAQLTAASADTDRLRSQIAALEKDKSTLVEDAQSGRFQAEQASQQALLERNKRMENEMIVRKSEAARAKLKQQVDMLQREQRNAMDSMRDQYYGIKEENERLRAAIAAQPSVFATPMITKRKDSRYISDEEARGISQKSKAVAFEDNVFTALHPSTFRPAHETKENAPESSSPSGPEASSSSPTDPEQLAADLLQDWRTQNVALRSELANARQQIQADSNASSMPHAMAKASHTFMTPSEKMRMQLEQENKILMQIVAQVKADLQKASMSSPPFSSAVASDRDSD